MAFVVEDGTGLTNSNSYISVADADTYFSDRNNTVWAALSTTQKEAYLIQATQYIDAVYSDRFSNIKLKSTQALEFPRICAMVYNPSYMLSGNYGYNSTYYLNVDAPECDYVYDLTGSGTPIFPDKLLQATAEMALKANSGDLLLDEEQRVIREKVGPLETEYSQYASQRKKYVLVDNLLKKYLSIGPSSTKVTRV